VNAAKTWDGILRSRRAADSIQGEKPMEIGLYATTDGIGYRDELNFFLKSTPIEEMRPVRIAQLAERTGFLCSAKLFVCGEPRTTKMDLLFAVG